MVGADIQIDTTAKILRKTKIGNIEAGATGHRIKILCGYNYLIRSVGLESLQ